MAKSTILSSLKIHKFFYIAWLFFLLNVINFRTSDYDQEKSPAVHVKRIVGQNLNPDRKMKKILLWNAVYGSFGFKFDDPSSFEENKCKVSNCMLSKDKALVTPETADAVVFLYTNLCNLPKIYGRKSYQRYVLLTDDPPNCFNRNYYKREPFFGGFFNWTMSYRANSDISWTKGWVQKVDKVSDVSQLKRLKQQQLSGKKKKLVAWYVARCGSVSEREGYITELKEYLQIDTYGPCGDLACPIGTDVQSCLDYIAENYKFVLTFERYICDDFVTKRFFDVLRRPTVPIVFGGADYESIAPPNSFIDALKMYPKQLASHLKLLDDNTRLYNRHLKWKFSYEVHTGYGEIVVKPFCDLCEKLHSAEPHKIYRDIDSWWYNSSKCSTSEERGIKITRKGKEQLNDIEIPWFSEDD